MKNDEEPPNMEDFNEGGVVKKPSRSFSALCDIHHNKLMTE